MKKILLINTSFREKRDTHYGSFGPPIGLLTIAAALERDDYEVDLIDPQIDDDYRSSLSVSLAEKPLFVGMSTYLGENIKHAVEMAHLVRQADPKIPIVLGGPMATSIPEVFFQQMPVDYIVMGAGEETIGRLTYALGGGGDPQQVPCVSYEKDGRVVLGEIYSFSGDLDDLAIPNLKLWERGILRMRSIPIVTSRGCYRGCAFCYNTFTGKRKYFLRSATHVLAEMEKWSREFDLDSFEFYDDNFLMEPQRALEIVAQMGLRKWSVSRVFGHLNEFKHVRPAQLQGVVRHIVMCVESGSPKIQKLLNKPIDPDEALNLITQVIAQGMGFATAFMFGLPGETDDDIRMSIELAARIRQISNIVTSTCFIYAPQPNDAIIKELASRQYIQFSLDAIANVEVVPVPPDNKLELRLRPWIRDVDRSFYLDFVQVWQHHFGGSAAPSCDLARLYQRNSRIHNLFRNILLPEPQHKPQKSLGLLQRTRLHFLGFWNLLKYIVKL